jgi:metal-sulfur cluster biosynthetic enzyme
MNESFHQAAARLDALPVPPADGAAAARGAIDEADVWRALSTVIDPEIGLDIVSVGLVYGVECLDDVVQVRFTLTTPGCPMQAVIGDGIRNAVGGVAGVGEVISDLVWEPAWHPGMIREDAW